MVSGRSNYTINSTRLPLAAFVIFVTYALSQGDTQGPPVWFVAIEIQDRSRNRERSGSDGDPGSVVEGVELVGVDGVDAAAEGEDDRQTDGCLGRGDGDREEHESLAVHGAGLSGKRDETEVDCIHHQLDAHE